jgi:streptogramin lyase
MGARSSACALAFGLAFILAATASVPCSAQDAPALAGQITSAEEGAMEGVVVSAKRDGSTITVSVVSDATGRYAFPAAKLEAGHYAVSVRAVGYQLAAPAAAEIASGQTASADLRLVKARNLSRQLTGGEWLASMPGTDSQKKILLGCTDCHGVQRVISSTHTADEFVPTFARMAGYYAGATPLHPQRLVGNARRNPLQGTDPKVAAEYLASINLSAAPEWSYPLKTFARPKGRATHVVITEYALPRAIMQPHDVILDADGMVWFSEFGEQFLGKLDPKTGKVTEYPLPVLKPGFPTGTLDLEIDQDGNLWLGMMYQAGIAKFDRKNEQFQVWPVPGEWQTDATQQAFLSPAASKVDGKVWVKNSDRAQILRFEPATGHWENFGSFKDPQTGHTLVSYGIPVDADNNVYLLDFSAGFVGRLDAKTEKLSVYPTPTPNSKPRRGRVDAQGRLWFAEYAGNAVGMFDPETSQIQEWAMPTPWDSPYDVVLDRNGEAWTGSMLTDRVARLDPKSGTVTEYLLPHETNIRRVFVDNSTSPVTFWTGNNHGASIVKLEPLD